MTHQRSRTHVRLGVLSDVMLHWTVQGNIQIVDQLVAIFKKRGLLCLLCTLPDFLTISQFRIYKNTSFVLKFILWLGNCGRPEASPIDPKCRS